MTESSEDENRAAALQYQRVAELNAIVQTRNRNPIIARDVQQTDYLDHTQASPQ